MFIIPELNAVDFSSIFGAVLVIFGYFGSKVTILSARDLGARCASLPHFNMSGRGGTQGTQRYHWARAGGRYQGHLRPFWGACQESDHLVGPSSRAAPRRRTPPRVDSVGPKVNIDIGLASGSGQPSTGVTQGCIQRLGVLALSPPPHTSCAAPPGLTLTHR